MNIVPHLAHVDHGWREESQIQAEALALEAKQLGCPFYSVRLNIEKKEDAARKARFEYFSSLFKGFQALLLAHQADDLAETVLKRLLEGSHLTNLGGMQPVSEQDGMTIWRPLLKVRKTDILSYLEEKSLKPILDSTNFDPTYLRARMRGEIFPFLNERFGKETTHNLTLLSERAYELKDYLDRRVAHALVHRDLSGTLIDLNGLEEIEKRHLLLKVAAEEKIVLTRLNLEMILNCGRESRQIQLKTRKILVDKGRVCFISFVPKDSNSIC